MKDLIDICNLNLYEKMGNGIRSQYISLLTLAYFIKRGYLKALEGTFYILSVGLCDALLVRELYRYF